MLQNNLKCLNILLIGKWKEAILTQTFMRNCQRDFTGITCFENGPKQVVPWGSRRLLGMGGRGQGCPSLESYLCSFFSSHCPLQPQIWAHYIISNFGSNTHWGTFICHMERNRSTGRDRSNLCFNMDLFTYCGPSSSASIY